VLDETVHIKGRALGIVPVELVVVEQNSGDETTDQVLFTIVDVDLDTNSDNSAPLLQDDDFDERIEGRDVQPGRLVDIGGRRAELTLSAEIDTVPSDWTVSLKTVSGADHFQLWDSLTDGSQITETPWNLDSDGSFATTLWVEGLSLGTVVLDLVLTNTTFAYECTDRVRLTVFDLQIDVPGMAADANNATIQWNNDFDKQQIVGGNYLRDYETDSIQGFDDDELGDLTATVMGDGFKGRWKLLPLSNRLRAYDPDTGEVVDVGVTGEEFVPTSSGAAFPFKMEGTAISSNEFDAPMRFYFHSYFDGDSPLYNWNSQGEFAEEVQYCVMNVDLTFPGQLQWWEEDNYESAPTGHGAFVPLNDNFDEQNQQGGQPVPDNQPNETQHRIVTGDGDLCEARLQIDTAGVSGDWHLEIPSKVKVWRKDTLDEIESGQTSAITDSTVVELYIEGMEASSEIGDAEIIAVFTPTATPSAQVRDDATITVTKFVLNELTFSGPGFNPVSSDPSYSVVSGIVESRTYDDKHWVYDTFSGEATAYPVSFKRDTTMSISGKWQSNVAIPTEAMMIWGAGPGDLEFPPTEVDDPANPTIDAVACESAFADEVDVFNSAVDSNSELLEINWKVSLDGGATWQDAGTSANPAYITLDDPLTTLYHTVLALSCKATDGETEQAGETAADVKARCVDKIWAEFADRDVKRLDGTPLTYYSNYMVANNNTFALLAGEDGSCHAWAHLLIDTWKVQGIDHFNEAVQLSWKDGSRPIASKNGFLVEKWDFAGNGTSGDATLPYVNYVLGSPFRSSWYEWNYAEVTDVDAGDAPAQSNDHPASFFYNHVVVKIGSRYYDPSYGAIHDTLQDFDDELSGFYEIDELNTSENDIGIDLNGDGQMSTTVWAVSRVKLKKNPNGNDDIIETGAEDW